MMGNGNGKKGKPKTMAVKTFLRHFIDITKSSNTDSRFCFILGAGASKQSGIPTGGELVVKWLTDLEDLYSNEDIEKWKSEEEIHWSHPGEAAKYYSQIYDMRFKINPEVGYSYLEDIMEGKEPSFGYSVLAQILANEKHNVIITTNFDSLMEDALFIYTRKRPLVCGHEVLAHFIRPIMRRPLIAKIHRDILLAPISDSRSTANLQKSWETSLTNLFKFYTPIVIGYGGNDGTLIEFLKKKKVIEKGIFWCYREADGEPAKNIRDLVQDVDGYLIPIIGFDELMLQLNNKLKYPLQDQNILEIAKKKETHYKTQVEEISKRLGKYEKDSEIKQSFKNIIKKEKRAWGLVLQAESENSPTRKERIYKNGLKKFPNSPELNASYANFLYSIKKNYERAKKYFTRALKLNPEDAIICGSYANFLIDIQKDSKGAEEYYRKALLLDPEHATNNGNYATFLMENRKDYKAAEEYYKKALKVDPDNAIINGNYANFLMENRKDYEAAEEYYKKAIKLDPKNIINNVNYATFLYRIKKDNEEAKKHFMGALELNPEDAIINSSYADFLKDIREDYDGAEEYYTKALELDPENANINGNYANLLKDIRKDYKGAEEYYLKALQNDPDNAVIKGNYAILLYHINKDSEGAEKFYREALELDPENANINGNYAQMLLAQGREEEGKIYLEKAFSLASDRKDVTIELWFYRFAHFPSWYDKAYLELIRLIREGYRSLHWDFTPNIDRAEKDRHPQMDRLKKLARIISQDAPIDIRDDPPPEPEAKE